MRTLLDDVSPEELRPIFNNIFRQAQRGKVLKKMRFMEGRYLLSLDGTGYFSSKKNHCPKAKRKNPMGDITYSHQMLEENWKELLEKSKSLI